MTKGSVTASARLAAVCFLLAALLPLVANRYTLFVGNMMLVQIILAVGLNLLVGYAGLLAFMNGALFGVGAYAAAVLHDGLHWPYWLTLPASGLVAMVIGVAIALPALRLSGLYLALATVAFAQFALWAFTHWDPVTGGPSGLKVAPVDFHPLPVGADLGQYWLSLLVAAAIVWITHNLLRSRIGRAFVAIRESETAAEAMAIDVTATKKLWPTLSPRSTPVSRAVCSRRCWASWCRKVSTCSRWCSSSPWWWSAGWDRSPDPCSAPR